VPESLWGASLGKAICGLRVVDVEGQPAQARFVMLRAALYSASERTPNLIWYVVQRLRTLPTDALALAELHGSVLTIAEIVTRVMLFISARRSNGFAGIHDLITRTRVVRQSITRAHRVAGSPLPAPPAQGPSAAATIGPYEIVADLGGGLRRGYDATLSRFVWIRTTHQDSGADLRRRRLSRRTRLRWLAGGAWSEGHWDAFEEPPGEPLTRLTAAQPWSLVRESLHDVASELAHGLEDGSLPPLTIDRIWLASSGRAWVLDFPGPGTASHRDQTVEANAPDIVSAQRFLDTVAQRMLCDPAANKPVLPLPAAEALQRIATGALASVGDLHSIASQLVRGPAFVTRRRRTLQLALCGLPALPLIQSTVRAVARISEIAGSSDARSVPESLPSWIEWMPFILQSGFVMPLMAVGAISIVCALVLGDGPLFRAFRITIVTADGRQASRWRTLVRALVGWGPLVVLSIGLVNQTALIITPELSAFLRGPVPPVAFPALLVGGIACALVTPGRGLQDRVVGTYLVPAE